MGRMDDDWWLCNRWGPKADFKKASCGMDCGALHGNHSTDWLECMGEMGYEWVLD